MNYDLIKIDTEQDRIDEAIEYWPRQDYDFDGCEPLPDQAGPESLPLAIDFGLVEIAIIIVFMIIGAILLL